MNVDKQPEPVDWSRCTCGWSYTGGQEGPAEDVRWDVRGCPKFSWNLK